MPSAWVSRALGRRLLGLLGCGIALGLGACATPAERADREAQRLGFARGLVRGSGFDHVVYHREADDPGSGVLHVYLEGDGSPAAAARWHPPDPTLRRPLALRLMALDPAPSLYLGRPCYHGAGPCSPWYWTLGRYGEEVVRSLAAAVRRAAEEWGAPGLVLIGHSGGGALAMLVAERLPETRAVVTLAGNLDPEAWAAHHGYEPLAGSLNPARRPPLDPRVLQLHLLGGRDAEVPPAVVEAALARQPGARRRLLPEADHDCCWEAVWPGLLAELRKALAAQNSQRIPAISW